MEGIEIGWSDVHSVSIPGVISRSSSRRRKSDASTVESLSAKLAVDNSARTPPHLQGGLEKGKSDKEV